MTQNGKKLQNKNKEINGTICFMLQNVWAHNHLQKQQAEFSMYAEYSQYLSQGIFKTLWQWSSVEKPVVQNSYILK